MTDKENPVEYASSSGGEGGYRDMGAADRLREYLKLMRFQATGAVWIVLVVGSLAQAGSSVTWLHALKLFFVAMFTYILAIVMNEYYDIEFDRASASLSTKPLVSGSIHPRRAIQICWISVVLSSLLVYLFWGPYPLLWFLLSVAVGAQYNIHGKKHYWMDVFVAIWAAMYCILGGMTVSPGARPWELNPLVYVMASMWFFRLVVGNSVEGGLKDLEHDLAAGAKTLPRWFGVSLEDGRIRYTAGWWLFELGLEAGFVLSILVPIYYGILTYSHVQMTAIAVLLLGMAVTLRHISPRRFDREDIKKHTFLHEAMGFGIMGIMLADVSGWMWALMILVVPLLWFAVWVRVIYGTRLPST
ncbi:MAG: UbiA family prenyltransferase [Thermoplasmata archaeon]|nr:UbiA family prenyltransferase [Thermoplasmata archaeon]